MCIKDLTRILVEKSCKPETVNWLITIRWSTRAQVEIGTRYTVVCFIARFAALPLPPPARNKTYWDLNRIWVSSHPQCYSFASFPRGVAAPSLLSFFFSSFFIFLPVGFILSQADRCIENTRVLYAPVWNVSVEDRPRKNDTDSRWGWILISSV